MLFLLLRGHGDLVSGPFVANVFFSSAVLSGPDAFPALTPPLCTPPQCFLYSLSTELAHTVYDRNFLVARPPQASGTTRPKDSPRLEGKQPKGKKGQALQGGGGSAE